MQRVDGGHDRVIRAAARTFPVLVWKTMRDHSKNGWWGSGGGARLSDVLDRYPYKLSPYLADLIESADDPLGRQFVPTLQELDDSTGWLDPLAEDSLSPVNGLVHRYPNRALWLVSHKCAAHCRFCTRKRRWKGAREMSEDELAQGLAYLQKDHRIVDVLLSGGDPLLLSVERLEHLLSRLRAVPHIQVIRIGTRVPGVLPEVVTPALAAMISKYHPVFMNLHFNHPLEITAESRQACTTLADAGIPLGSQTVLLRGVNDDAAVLGELFQGLLTMRVRPYYLMQMDLTAGTGHFRTPVASGLKILLALRNRISGIAMPQFVIDLPGGHGKVPLVPNTIRAIHEDRVEFMSYTGKRCIYPLLQGEHEELRRLRFG